MKVIRTVLSKKSKAEIEDYLLKYFRTNGFYNITVKDGMKFSTYSEAKPILSPKRLSRDVLIHFSTEGNQQKVVVTFDIGGIKDNPLKTSLDKEFYEDFANHFKESFEKNGVEKFATETYDKRAKAYSKPFIIVGVIGVLISIIITIIGGKDWWTNSSVLIYLATFGVGTFVADWYVKKQRLKILEA